MANGTIKSGQIELGLAATLAAHAVRKAEYDNFVASQQTASVNGVSSGTVYTLTATSAKVDFGTTDPSVVPVNAGTYLLLARVVCKLNAATFVANETLTLKLRRTNNTPADLANSTTVLTLPVITAITDGLFLGVPAVIYTTANIDDNLELWAALSTVPSAGSVTVEEAQLLAVRLF